MTDEVLKELWNIKDNIAREHVYNIDGLAEYYLKKQSSRHGRFYQEKNRNNDPPALNRNRTLGGSSK